MNHCRPDKNCDLCPDLYRHRQILRQNNPDWYNAPVMGFGDKKAKLLILGLAPGERGANRTGRPFTGDKAGDILYEALHKNNFATGIYGKNKNDGLKLKNCFISNSVKCAPPKHRDISTEERQQCRTFLSAEFLSLTELKIILVLGRSAHQSLLELLKNWNNNIALKDFPFQHRKSHQTTIYIDDQPRPISVIDSYHCSGRNINTGVLSKEDFFSLFADIYAMVNT